MVQNRQPKKHQEVERPNAKNSPHIERLNMYPSHALALAHQEFSNKKCAQQKEDRNAEWADVADPRQPQVPHWIGFNIVHAVEAEHAQKCEETQRIEFRPIIATSLRRTALVLNCHSFASLFHHAEFSCPAEETTKQTLDTISTMQQLWWRIENSLSSRAMVVLSMISGSRKTSLHSLLPQNSLNCCRPTITFRIKSHFLSCNIAN